MAAIAAGDYQTVALKNDGSIVTWGDSRNGLTSVPSGLAGVTAIAAGASHTVALKSDGSVIAWGTNYEGQTSVPSGLSGVTAISAGRYHTVALAGGMVSFGPLTIGTSSAAKTFTIQNTGTGALTISSVSVIGGNASDFSVNTTGMLSSLPAATGSTTFTVTFTPSATGLRQTTLRVLNNDIDEGSFDIALSGTGIAPAPEIAIEQPMGNALPGRSVVAWGLNDYNQTSVPLGLTGVTAISAGVFHTVALKSDGSVIAWGDNGAGQTNVPAGLSGVTAISAGYGHTVALKSDGSVVAWGANINYGQTNVPDGLSGVTAIAAGRYHSVALKGDGSVVTWGANSDGQTSVPIGLSGVIAIAAGASHTVALKSDGSVVAWGKNDHNQTSVPIGLTDVTAIAAGASHTVALKSDGSIVAWGYNGDGQADVPSGLSGVTAISAGFNHTVVLKSDGSIFAWGDDSDEQTSVPSGLTGVAAISAGGFHTVALTGGMVGFGTQNVATTSVAKTFTIQNTGTAALTISSVSVIGGNASDFSVNTTGMLSSLPAATGSTTFTVTFTPSATGLRQTTLRVQSNDSDEGNFDITLSGTGIASAPTVTSISPASGPIAGGTSVTITGTGFTGATGVTIGGAPATNVIVVNATTITCTTPAGTAGARSVVVTTPVGANPANTLFSFFSPPAVVFAGSSVGGTSAIFAGNVTSDGGSPITERGMVFSVKAVNNNPIIGGTGVTKLSTTGTTGTYTITATGLSLMTNYDMKFYAINAAGTSYSSIQNFTTTGLPSVTTPNASSITAFTAILNGSVSSDGGASITERGFVLSVTSLNSDPQIGGANVTKLSKAGTTGGFTANASALLVGTGYSLRAYAINGNGTRYSPVVTFSTLAPVPLTVVANNATRAYGAANPAFTGTITGIEGTDPITATYATSAHAASPPGTYPIVPSLAAPAGVLGKYAVTTTPGTLTVTAAPTSTVAESATARFSTSAQNFTPSAVVTAIASSPTGSLTFQVKNGTADIGTAITLPLSSTGRVSGPYALPTGLVAGTYTIHATYSGDASHAASSTTADLVIIPPPPVASLLVSGFANPATAGTASNITVTARAADGSTLTTYTGTVTFSSSDAEAALPASYTFTPVDFGVKTFTATLRREGTHSLTVTDAANAVSGSQSGIVVYARDNGTSQLYAWGDNLYGGIGDGTRTQRLSPVPVTGMTDVSAFSGGHYHSLAVKSDSSVWAWGWNSARHLGDNTTIDRLTPVPVKGPGGIGQFTGISAVAAGIQSNLALKTDGTVWAWGGNSFGELGDGTTQGRATPVRVGTLTGVTAIACGQDHGLALKSDGTVWAWGRNKWGELGDNTRSVRFIPVQVKSSGGTGFLTGVTNIAAGYGFSLARKSDGTVWTWGYNGTGELGDGSTVNRLTPVQVFITGVTAVSGGGWHSMALKADGTVWTWGGNFAGALGNGLTGGGSLVPAQVKGIHGSGLLTGVSSISCGYLHSTARLSNGGVVAWGSQIGNGSNADTNTPVRVSGLVYATLAVAGPVSLSTRALVVNPNATRFIVSAAATTGAGAPLDVTVRAVDAAGNSVAHAGTVRLTSTDPLATLPAAYTFLPGDKGVKTFSVTLRSAGAHRITAADTPFSSINGFVNTTVSGIGTMTIVSAVKSEPSPSTRSYVFSTYVTALAGVGLVNEGLLTFRLKNSGGSVIGNPVLGAIASSGRLDVKVNYDIPGGTPAGLYQIEVSYSGSAKFNSSIGLGSLRHGASASPSPMAATSGKAKKGSAGLTSTTTTGYSFEPQFITLTAPVTSSLGTVNEGSVVFAIYDGSGSLIGSPIVADVSNDSASTSYLLPAALPAGDYTVTMSYSGGENFDPGEFEETLTVTPATSLLNISGIQATYSSFTQSVLMPASVVSSAGVLDSGSVTFQLTHEGVEIGTATTSTGLTNGAATVIYTLPAGAPAGTYVIEASYSGSSSFDPAVGIGFLTLSNASDARLAELSSSSPLTLSPGFSSAQLSYSTTVANPVTSLTLTPAATDPGASVRVNGTLIPSGISSEPITLNLGLNTITTLVTAQDGTTTSTYTLAITRQTGFETWAAENGVSTGSDRQFSNYAFGLPPGNQGSRSIAISGESISQDGSPVVLISNGGANIYALYGRRKDRSTAGLSYAVEFSGDLASWETATAVPSVIASDADTEAVVIPFPAQVAGKPTRFFRVTLTQ